MVKIGRNDPCSCGSGKKYKNCCGKNQVVSMDRILNDEMIQLQMEVLEFALDRYPREIKTAIQESEFPLDDPELEIEIQEIVHFMLMTWIIFDVAVEGDQRIIDRFIQHKSPHIKRDRLKKILSCWSEGTPFVGRLVSKEDNHMFVLEDRLNDQVVRVQVLEVERYQATEIESLIIGFIVPINEHTFTFFTTYVDLLEDEAEEFEDEVLEIYNESLLAGEDGDDFFTHYFPEILERLFFDEEVTITPESFEWGSHAQELVADLFYANVTQEASLPDELRKMGLVLWKTFCERENPSIRNPQLFAAALHYLVGQLFPINSPTQKQLATLYGVSSSSLSSKYRELEMALGHDIASFFQGMDGAEPSPFELEVHSSSASNEEKAEALIDQAYQARGNTRFKLANQAKALDPTNLDAYILIGEGTFNYDKKLAVLQEGLRMGEQVLGASSFEEFKGHFWGFVETRPYMRVKLSYANALLQGGEFKDAIAQYEELLELNEQDNQGARYQLFAAYIETRRLDDAERLLEHYPEGNTAADLYNRCLVEGLRNGKSTKFKSLLAQAENQNPYVMDYLRSVKKMPRDIPDSYRLGDPNEAIIYVDMFGQLWRESQL